MVHQLEQVGLVRCWQYEGQQVIQVCNWRRAGNSKYSRFPGPDGSFRIAYATVETRDGPVEFVATSLPGNDPMPMGSVSHSDGVGMGSVSHPYTKTGTNTGTKTKGEGATASPSLLPEAPLRERQDSSRDRLQEAQQALEAAWHAVPGLPRIRSWSQKRKAALRSRLRDSAWLAQALQALQRIEAGKCPFLLGENQRGWVANLDWFLKPDSVIRILEGHYDATTGQTGRVRDDLERRIFVFQENAPAESPPEDVPPGGS